jgi:hypothetical protein
MEKRMIDYVDIPDVATEKPIIEEEYFSQTQKIFTFCFALFVELTVSLVVTGWPAFLPVLIDYGAFYNYCENTTSINSLSSNKTNQCPAQLSQLGI